MEDKEGRTMTINLLQATNSCSNGKFFYWTLSVQALDMLLNKEVSLRDIVTNFCILLLPKLDQYGKPAVVPDTDHNNSAHQQPPPLHIDSLGIECAIQSKWSLVNASPPEFPGAC
jgi:hypothetical protein